MRLDIFNWFRFKVPQYKYHFNSWRTKKKCVWHLYKNKNENLQYEIEKYWKTITENKILKNQMHIYLVKYVKIQVNYTGKYWWIVIKK